MVPTASTTDREIVMTRVFDAPRELVFDVWTDPKHIDAWWGPRGFANATESMDVRPGGTWRFVMHGPDGVDYPNTITYLEVARPERLVYLHGGGEDGTEGQFQVTVTFAAEGGQTRLTMLSLFASAAARDFVVREVNAIELGNQTLDRFAERVALVVAERRDAESPRAACDLVITRVFDAPRELVFDAWTDPQRLVRWWGPRGFTTPACTLDLRPGGTLHYCMRSPEGEDTWCGGIFREIVAPERLVVAQYFADAAGNRVSPTRYGMSAEFPPQMLMTVTLAEHAGKTLLTMRQTVAGASADERSGSRQGWCEGFDRLAEYLTTA